MDGTGEGETSRRAARRQARAERRHARWHHPPHPKDWRYFVGGLGRILIVIGLLMFGFVAYQLWGTGLEYAQAQNRLDDDLEDLFAAASTTTTATPRTTTSTTLAPDGSAPATTRPPGATTTTTTVPVTVPVPPLEEGDAIARIEIPAIGLDAVVVAGVHPSDLKKGPGHYPTTPMPGQLGNSAIAGHRTTYGQPFYDLDDIQPGEEIVLTTVQGRFVYRMTANEIVAPSQGDVVLTKDPTVATLTLTTCDPKYTATNRLIVYADLDPLASGGPGLPPVLDYLGGEPSAGTLPGETPATAAAASESATTTTPTAATVGSSPGSSPGSTSGATAATVPAASTELPGPVTEGAGGDPSAVDAFSHGWFSDSAAWPHVIGWGLLCAAIVVGGWFVARAFERYWVGALVALVPFVVALYFFYQNVNRLLPAAI